MGMESSIQWTDATWNIAVGCKKVDGDCKFCYMYRDSMDGKRYNPKQIRQTTSVFNMPLKKKEPSKIFTSSLTDFALPEIDPYRAKVWEIIRACPQHTFQMLTKRPERLPEILPLDWGMGYKNVWLGTSVGNDKAIDRIEKLCLVDAEVRFVSFEPLWTRLTECIPIDYADGSPFINWAIIGGESGNDNGPYKYRECRIEWIEELIQQCREADVPVFVKQLGTYLAKKMGLKDRHGGNIEEWPRHLQIREFPNV